MRQDELWLIGVLLLLPALYYPIYRYECWLTGERPPYWRWFVVFLVGGILMAMAMNW